MSFGVRGVVQTLRWVPPGRFIMGSPEGEEGRYDDEIQHEVELSRGVWLADTPVTQALWVAVMGENPSKFAGPNSTERPVEQVSWEDCQTFIERLNDLVPGLEARLPTEAEWERACRGGTEGARWAEDLDAIAWYWENSGGKTQPVKAKQPNPYGLYDMLGNVWEWCQDWVAPHERSYAVDPRGPTVGSDRGYRGGSWFSIARNVRAAYRSAVLRGNRREDLGFRLARG